MDVRMNLVDFFVLISYVYVAWIEYDRTKYEVSIVKIPRRVIKGPNDKVATSVILLPRMPIKTRENII